MGETDTRDGFQTVLGMVLRNWSALLCFEVIYRGAGYAFVFPFLGELLHRLPALAGQRWLGQENAGLLQRSPGALLALAAALLLAGLCVCLEIAALTLCGEAGWRRERVGVLRLWGGALVKTAGLLHPRRLPVLLLLPVAALSGFALVSGYLRTVRLPDFILEAVEGSPRLLALLAAAVLLFHALLFFYLFGFPALILEGASFSGSWRESLRLLRGRKARTLGALLAYGLGFCAVLLAAGALGVCLLAGAARLRYGPAVGAGQFRMSFLAWEGVWRTASGALLSVFLCAAAVLLYHRSRGDARPTARPGPRTARALLMRGAAVLGTLALLLVFGETEAGGRVLQAARPSTQVVAHRAGAALAPENTLAALEQAVRDGADMAEIDVQQLRDGTLIVMHDPNFKRSTGVDLPVDEAEYAQVRGLDAGSGFSHAFAGEPVPTLEQMLLAANGRIRLMIELKVAGDGRGIERETLAQIEACGMRGRCVVASMSLDVLRRVKELDPGMPTVYITALLLGRDLDWDYLDAYSVETSSLTRELVLQVHGQGRQIYAWTANSDRAIQRVLRCHPDGVITDNPLLAQYYLEAGGENLLLESACELFFPQAKPPGRSSRRSTGAWQVLPWHR